MSGPLNELVCAKGIVGRGGRPDPDPGEAMLS